jgi:ubiquinone/menaquinone biosynthesis C-methylase UbiE
VQYRTDSNLAARQSIYQFQNPRVGLYDRALDLADLQGNETVLDIGCGNGGYLATLARRGHGGVVIGADMSIGMLEAAQVRAGAAHLMVADAQRIPFPNDTFDLTLAMHMLYHVPDRALGIAELRRTTRPDGVVLVVTNSEDHFRELNEIVVELTGTQLPSGQLRFRMETAEPELRVSFEQVERHDFRSRLELNEVQPVLEYVASTRMFVGGDDRDSTLREIGDRVGAVIARDGVFTITTAPGCFVCR